MTIQEGDLESLLLAVNKQPREAPTFDGTTDEGYAVTLMEEAEGFRVRAMDPLRPWSAVERVLPRYMSSSRRSTCP